MQPQPCLEISTKIGCPLFCNYCPQNLHIKEYTSKSRETVMSLETFKTCLSKIPREVEIIFAGMAEPFLNPDCFEMILKTYSEKYKIGVYTTLVGCDWHKIDLLKKLTTDFGFQWLHFCIHLPDADGNMKLKITDQYLATLKHAIEINIHTNLVCIGKIHPAVEAITGFVEDSTHSLISRAGNLKSLAIKPKTGQLKCTACGDKLDHNILLPNGEVLLCCMDYGQKHVIGNLLTDSYEDLFKSPEYLRVMEGLKTDGADTLCRVCEISGNVN